MYIAATNFPVACIFDEITLFWSETRQFSTLLNSTDKQADYVGTVISATRFPKQLAARLFFIMSPFFLKPLTKFTISENWVNDQK